MQPNGTSTRVSRSAGYGSILAAVLLFLVTAIGVAVLGSYAMRSSQRRTSTGAVGKEVYQGILGNPDLGTFGYLGDSGTYPGNLTALLTPGTNGPLIRDVPIDNGTLMDGFFGPLEYWRSVGVVASPATHGIAIISRGPDHVSSNTSPSPNDATVAFIGTTPTNPGYITTPDNIDNVVAPDIHATRSAINVGYTGSLAYNLTNFDSTSSSLVSCPASYSVELRTNTRPDMEKILAPAAASATFELIQGMYTVRLVANSNPVQSFFTEAVAVYPGTTNTRNIRMNSVTTASTPAFNLRMTNQTGANIWVRRTVPSPAADVLGPVANAATGTISVNACSKLEVRSAAGGGGTLFETFSMPMAITSKTVSGLTNTLTIADTTTASAIVLVGNPGLAIGSVSRLRQKVFTIPRFERVEVLGVNGVSLEVFTSFSADTQRTY